jgi:hypothetical protein
MLKFVYEKVGTPYDFIGIADEMAETTTGDWPGEKGENAEKREFCSEAIATIIHHVRVDHFKLCYKTTPEEFVEDEHIKLAV